MSSFGIPVRNGLGVGLLASTSLSTRNSSAFSPASLFAAGEQGAWYDPSDLTSMRQLSTGATAAAVGSPVGFIADKRLMGGQTFDAFVAGQPELVTNGTFDSNVTGWTGNLATLSWDAGLLRMTTTGSNGSAYQAFSTVIGTAYLVNGDCLTNVVNKRINKSDTTSMFGANFVEFLFSTAGTVPLGGRVFVATATTTYIHLGFSGSGAGNVLDFDNISVKAIPGNHATQSNAAQRPTYGVVPAGGRRNLATFTEQFDNTTWNKLAATVSTNVGVAPDGTTTADRIVEDGTNAGHGFQNLSLYSGVTTGTLTVNSIYCKADTRSRVAVAYTTSGGVAALNYVAVDLTNGTILSTLGVGGTATSVGDGWYRITLNPVAMGATTGRLALTIMRNTDTTPTAYLGDGTSGVLVWGAQGEIGSTATAYQRVVTAFDVTEAGVASRSYLSFDGSDDGMLTGNIVPGTDKAQVFAGARKLSDAAAGVAVELSVDTNTNAGSFALFAPLSAGGANYRWRSRGSGSSSNADGATYTAPITNVISGIGDIAADTAILRVNGTQVASSATDQGTGNYLTYPLYIGRRAGTSLPLNGQIFGLIVRFGANLLDATVTQTETWLANRVAPTVVIP